MYADTYRNYDEAHDNCQSQDGTYLAYLEEPDDVLAVRAGNNLKLVFFQVPT